MTHATNLKSELRTSHPSTHDGDHRDHRPSQVWGISSLPAQWREKPLKRVVDINSRKLPDTTDPNLEIEYVDIGNVNLASGITASERYRFEDAPSRARRLPQRGDTIVSTVRTYLKAVAHIENPPENLVVSTGFAVLRPSPDLDPRFLYRLVQSEPFVERIVAASVGVSYPAINASSIGGFVIPVPPLEEQRAIANFLDRATARIDELIAKKQAIISRLLEKRSLVISRAVMEGVKGGNEHQQTNLEWLTAVPAHWAVKKLKFVSTLQTGLTLGKKYGESEELVTRPYLRVANVQDGFLDLDEITTVDVPEKDVPRYELMPGDVLLTEGGDFDKLGRGYVWENQIPCCLHQNHIFSVRPFRDILDSHFLAALFSSSHGKNYFTSTSTQTTNLATTNSTKLKAFPILLPPLDEQMEILRVIRLESGRVDEAVEAVGLAIRKLNELRSALISSAVTGQLDVRSEVTITTALETVG